MTRYHGWPGQAISYKVGERVIMELREELKRRQGAAFSLKDFHARVLGSGPVGLELLRERVLWPDAPGAMSRARVVSSREIHRGRVVHLFVDTITLPNGTRPRSR